MRSSFAALEAWWEARLGRTLCQVGIPSPVLVLSSAVSRSVCVRQYPTHGHYLTWLSAFSTRGDSISAQQSQQTSYLSNIKKQVQRRVPWHAVTMNADEGLPDEAFPIFDHLDVDLVVKVLSHTAFSGYDLPVVLSL